MLVMVCDWYVYCFVGKIVLKSRFIYIQELINYVCNIFGKI